MAITKVGVIGEGELSQALTRILARANIETVISNGRPEGDLFARGHEHHGGVTTATLKEAADEEIVLLSLPWKQVPEALSMIPDWEGRILVDATDPVLPDFEPADLGGRTSSEIVNELAPGAQLVKAFNTLSPKMLAADPERGGGRRVLFYSGDHVRAKGEVARLIARLGFAGVDVGSLAEGGRLQQYPHGVLRDLNLIRLEVDAAEVQPAVI
jgi:predicted dinucleotide-binding enzyme